MSAGTYRITVGDVFYIGSSSNLRKRRYTHQGMLLNWKGHPNKGLAEAFLIHKEFSWVVTDYLTREEGEPDDSFRTRLRAAEQFRLDEVKGDPKLANVSMNSRGPDAREDMTRKWQDPAFRERMAQVNRERIRRGVSAETREKMAEAKRGRNNPKARAVEVTKPDGTIEVFPSATDAAKFFGVKQQILDFWLKGKWPSEGCRPQHRHITAYSARFVQPDIAEYVI